jgi:hypothetical protein
MTAPERNRRALIALGILAPIIIGYAIFSGDESAPAVVEAVDNIPAAEKRLARLRELAATVPGKEQILSQVRAELSDREKGLIQADTPAQAQAQLLQILRKIARAQTPPVDLRSTEVGQAKPFGRDYGEVAVSANFDCGIEQLLNMLSDLTAQSEAIGTSELRVGTANPKQKTMPVRLTVSALVRRGVVPESKGTASF